MTKRVMCLLMMGLFLSLASASAATRVQKLSENLYMITLKKWTGWGGEGRVLRQLNTKAASLCLETGYKWFEIEDQTSHGRGFVKTAAGTFKVKFYKDKENDDLLSCESLATDAERAKMRKALANANK